MTTSDSLKARLSRRTLVRGASFVAVVGALSTGARPQFVFADERKEKEEEKRSVDQKLETLRGDLQEVDSELADAYLKLAETELKIPDAQTRLDEARAAAEQARLEDERLAGRLEMAEEEERTLLTQVSEGKSKISSSNEDVSKASMQAYMGSGMPNPATVYLGAADPQDAVDRTMNYRLTLESQGAQLATLRDTQTVNVNAADRLTAVREEIADLKDKSAAAVIERERAETQAADAKRELDDLYTAQKSQTTSLETLKGKYKASETQLTSQSSQLNADIEALIAQEKSSAQASNTKAPVSTPSSSGGGAGFAAPVVGRRSSMFGYRVHPIFRTRKLHAGMDYAVGCGVPVKSIAAGKVLSTSYNRRAGNKVIVSHGIYNGQLLTSSYHHLQGFAVSAGQSIAKGQAVGQVGTTGSSTGCHLHFETHLDGQPLDPRTFIG